ncbi:MAG: efflux RND transporter periplasmic adaptor subunit [Planctomycetaceae bacterium]|nr:efflux RND transporter periplasmic adaptor subunit [Planctomycetaceae bacterium]
MTAELLSAPHSIIRGMALLLSCTMIVGCERKPTPLSETPPPEVTVAYPVQQEFADFAEFTGRTEAAEQVDVQARVSGYLDKINFEEGEEVEAETVLFEIDPRPYQAALDAADAEVQKTEAALTRAQADLARNKELNERGAVTKDQLESVIADEAVSRANVAAAKAAYRQADLDLKFTKVISPISGRVSKANITKGNLVSAVSITGQPLTTVVSTNPIHVYFDVDERTLLRAQAENRKERGGTDKRKLSEVQWPLWIKLANENSFKHQGVLNFVDNQVNPGTGTIQMRGEFKNEEEVLIPGLFVTVRIPLSKPRPHLLVPSRAIGTDQSNKYVLVVDENNVVQYRLVVLGVQTDDGLREIVTGLEPDDRIIIDGLQRAQPGTTVTINKPDSGTSDSATEGASETSAEETSSPSAEPAPANGGSAQ